MIMHLWLTGYKDRLAATLLIAIMAANPLFFFLSSAMLTEATALAILLAVPIVLNRGGSDRVISWFIAGIALGIMLGVRLSWWPYALAFMAFGIYYRRLTGILPGVALGMLIWLIPEMAIVGPHELFKAGAAFTFGHFTDWGGAISSANGANNRIFILIMQICATLGLYSGGSVVLSMLWTCLFILGAISIIKKWRGLDSSASMYLAATALYLVWLAFGQNINNSRHFAPVVPAFIIMLAPAAKRWSCSIFFIAVSIIITTLFLYASVTNRNPPVAQMAEWLNASHADTTLYCGPVERYFDRYPSTITVKSVKSMATLQDSVLGQWPPSEKLLVCDDIPGFTSHAMKPVAEFKAVNNPLHSPLKIYNLKSF